MVSPYSTGRRPAFLVLATALVTLVTLGVALAAQARREVQVVARGFAFHVAGTSGAEIRVTQNDLVHVTFSTEDPIPHSFTVEDRDDSHYRIMRRAEPGKPVSFDFRADQPGTFRFYCSLTMDDRCKEMAGVLIVEPPR